MCREWDIPKWMDSVEAFKGQDNECYLYSNSQLSDGIPLAGVFLTVAE